MVLGLGWPMLPSAAGVMGSRRFAQQEWPAMVRGTLTSGVAKELANRCARPKPHIVGASRRPK